MNDRELLELAAKAAGLVIGFSKTSPEQWRPYVWNDEKKKGRWWNPIENDGDALRLAVKLHLFDASGFMKFRLDETRQDPTRSDYEITRLAIVRAAAEIGRRMQEGGAA